jgi:hypothetical protein
MSRRAAWHLGVGLSLRILSDQDTQVALRESLRQHDASTACERGWSKRRSGEPGSCVEGRMQ